MNFLTPNPSLRDAARTAGSGHRFSLLTSNSLLPLCCQAAEIVVTNTRMTADTAANLDGTW